MSTHQPDYYAVLKVAPTATGQEISRAYRSLMRIHHPDVDDGTGNSATDDGGAGLLGIMEAFEVLHDPIKRAEYDRAVAFSNARRGGPREVPVRRVQQPQPPLLGVTPVRWERGPWADAG